MRMSSDHRREPTALAAGDISVYFRAKPDASAFGSGEFSSAERLKPLPLETHIASAFPTR